MDIKIAKESLPHILSLMRAQKDNKEFQKAFTDGFFTEAGFKDFEKMIHVYAIVNIFIQEHQISCPEATIGDEIYENAPTLVEELANVVGYYKHPDDEDDDDE